MSILGLGTTSSRSSNRFLKYVRLNIICRRKGVRPLSRWLPSMSLGDIQMYYLAESVRTWVRVHSLEGTILRETGVTVYSVIRVLRWSSLENLRIWTKWDLKWGRLKKCSKTRWFGIGTYIVEDPERSGRSFSDLISNQRPLRELCCTSKFFGRPNNSFQRESFPIKLDWNFFLILNWPISFFFTKDSYSVSYHHFSCKVSDSLLSTVVGRRRSIRYDFWWRDEFVLSHYTSLQKVFLVNPTLCVWSWKPPATFNKAVLKVVQFHRENICGV